MKSEPTGSVNRAIDTLFLDLDGRDTRERVLPRIARSLYFDQHETPRRSPPREPLPRPEQWFEPRIERREVMPHRRLMSAMRALADDSVSDAQLSRMARALNRAFDEFDIRSPRQVSAFLAQSAHETANFTALEERGRPSRHGGFHGRGFLHLTHRANYELAGEALGVDLVRNPDAVRDDLSLAARTAAWFWRHGNGDLNTFADRGDFETVTRRINGGTNGWEDRNRLYAEATRHLVG